MRRKSNPVFIAILKRLFVYDTSKNSEGLSNHLPRFHRRETNPLQFAIEWLGTFRVDAYDENGPEHPEFSIGGAYRPTSVRVAIRTKE